MEKFLNRENITSLKDFTKDMECLHSLEEIAEKDINELIAKMKDVIEDLKPSGKSKLHIVCVGIYNSGKSTLLNILSDTENFAVGVVPTTDTLDKLETDDCIYVDTPGLNAKISDDNTAIQAFRDADVILFVSNIQNGGLNKAEAEYLDILADILGGKEMLLKQTIFLLSHSSQTEDTGKVVAEHKKLLKEQLGKSPETVLSYDSVSYQDGCEAHNDELIEESNVKTLIDILQKKKEFMQKNKPDLWDERLTKKAKKVCECLKDMLLIIDKKISSLKAKKEEKEINPDKLQEAITACKEIINKTREEIKPPKQGYWRIEDRNYLFLDFSVTRDVKENSEYAAKRRIKEILERPYNRRDRAIRNHAHTVAECLAEYYLYEHAEGNYYFDYCQTATASLLQCNDILTKIGVYLPKELLEEIKIMPDIKPKSESAIAQELYDNVVEYGDLYRLNDYVEYVDIDVSEEYVGDGMFGRMIFKNKYYSYNLYSAVEEMVKDLRFFDNNLDREWASIERAAKSFTEKLKKTLKERLSAIKAAAKKAGDDSAKDTESELQTYTLCKNTIEKYFGGYEHDN